MEKRLCVSGPNRDGGSYDQAEVFPISRGTDNDPQLAGPTGARGRSTVPGAGNDAAVTLKQQIPNGAIRQGVFGCAP